MKIVLVAVVVAAVGLLTSVGAARADEWQVLRDDARIHNGLTLFAIGRQIHRVCPDISARPVRALTFVEGLIDHAQDLGFSRSQIRTFIDSRPEQERYLAIARAYFSQRGADMDLSADVCRVGRDEIAAESAIGRMLR